MGFLKVYKSSRHSRITGNFAEYLVLYWLSKHGFECAYIDHVGIDIIARNPKTREIIGISVKSRSRNTGKEGEYINIPNETFDKVTQACKDFNCRPYFAIVVDERNMISIFIVSMKELLRLFPKGKRVSGWKMSKKWIEEYKKNKNIKIIEFRYDTLSWW